MKITDEGFKHMLTLGLLSATNVEGVYLLYTWEGVRYYCGALAADFKGSDLEGVFIELNTDQLKQLPMKVTKNSETPKHGPLAEVLDFFETAVVLKLSDDKSSFKGVLSAGTHSSLKRLSIDAKVRSPFKVVKQSLMPFHGFYSPLEPLNDELTELGINTEKLWMTAVPIIKNNVFKGVLMGLSHDVEYGTDVIKVFNEHIPNMLKKILI